MAELRARALPRVHVHEGDFLDVPPETWFEGDRPYRVAANLPYNVSTPVLGRLLRHAREGRVADAVLMLQKEVADRLIAVPGTGDYGPLAIAMALQADVSRVFVLPPGAFRPPPKVHSAVVRIAFRAGPGHHRGPRPLRRHRPARVHPAQEDAGDHAAGARQG